MKTIQHTLLATGLLAASSAFAVINIDTVQVGDAGNTNDSTGYGGVGYDYHIGTYEVTNSQYTAFLNATAATDTHSLYNTSMNSDAKHGGITRAGSSGSYTYSVKSGFSDKPVNYVSFWDAARFTNYLTTGGTESGVYVLTPTGISNNTITRDATAWANGGFAVASENEWYKAAYYQPVGAGGDTDSYWLYPTQSNSITTADANYNFTGGTVTDVGTYSGDASYYGTFDQGGNVWEWNDAILSTSNRGLLGGSFSNNDTNLQSSLTGNSANPTLEISKFGFRVSSVSSIPEPSAYAAIFGSLALAIAIVRRRGRRTL
jgi:formylglycine-generating enzyme required for sulfatase activity